MDNGELECAVSQLREMQPRLRANDWRSPLVLRVSHSTKYEDGQGKLAVDYKWNDQTTQKDVRFIWEGLGEDFSLCLNSYQEHVLTEFAALGIMCALMSLFPKLRITEVTRRGEKADYWIGKDHLVEVSGEESGNLEALRDKKANQLKANPHRLPGFVCVVHFESLSAYLWFYEVTK